AQTEIAQPRAIGVGQRVQRIAPKDATPPDGPPIATRIATEIAEVQGPFE
ncbi:MAG: hypothetical protein QOD30_1248, partial [Actinomycetota bacterium]|nr:hypothetical protein [Actinomycetota bacterium]